MTTTRTSSRGALAFALLALLAVGTWFLWSSSKAAPKPQLALAPEMSVEGSNRERNSPAEELPNLEPGTQPSDGRLPNAPLPLELRCVADEDGSALKGVRAFGQFDGEPRGESAPSDEEGKLQLPSGIKATCVLWAPRRVAVSLRPEELRQASEVRMVAADCAIDLVLTEMTLDHELIRSTLLLRDRSLRAGPWTPELKPGALDVYSAEDLAPGIYDLFFWIKQGREAPRPHQVRGIELAPGERKRVSHSSEDALPDDEADS